MAVQRCGPKCFRCVLSTVLLLNGLAMLALGAVCTFVPDIVLAFVTQGMPGVTPTYVATGILSVGGALLLCQSLLVAAGFVVWVQATLSVATTFTVAVLVFTDVQWLGVLFLTIGYHGYEAIPTWLLGTQIGGCAFFTFINAMSVMWVFFFNRSERSRSPLQVMQPRGQPQKQTAPNLRSRHGTGSSVTELEDPLLESTETLDDDRACGDDIEEGASELHDGSGPKDGRRPGKLKDEVEQNYGFGRLFSLVKPHICWLIAGCIALLVRLPFSLAQPHFVSACIGCLINSDYDGAKYVSLLCTCVARMREHTLCADLFNRYGYIDGCCL